jgi:hypothetical protein
LWKRPRPKLGCGAKERRRIQNKLEKVEKWALKMSGELWVIM